jgi:hypothetical protein
LTAPLHAERYGAGPSKTAAENTAALNAMVAALPAAGGDMRIGSGEIQINAPIALPAGKRFSITGNGSSGTRIKLASGSNCDLFTYTGVFPSTNPGGSGGYTNSANQDWLIIGDLTLDGNKAGQTATSRGIYLTAADYVVLDRLFLHDWWSNAVRLDNCDEGTFSSSMIMGIGVSGTGRHGIYMGAGTHDWNLVGLGVESCFGAGVLFTGAFENELAASNFWGNYRHVEISAAGVRDIKVTGGIYEAATDAAILVSGTKQQIHGAKIMGTGTVGISLSATTDSQVMGAMVDGPTTGIVESGAANRNQIALCRVFAGGITVVGASTVQTANMLA